MATKPFPFVAFRTSSGVHSLFEVGLERAMTTGRSSWAARRDRSSGLKSPALAVTPMRTVARLLRMTSSSPIRPALKFPAGDHARGWANGFICGSRFSQSSRTSPGTSRAKTRRRTSSSLRPSSLSLARMWKAIPAPACPSPAMTKR